MARITGTINVVIPRRAGFIQRRKARKTTITPDLRTWDERRAADRSALHEILKGKK